LDFLHKNNSKRKIGLLRNMSNTKKNNKKARWSLTDTVDLEVRNSSNGEVTTVLKMEAASDYYLCTLGTEI
jgi:hypothetical protein